MSLVINYYYKSILQIMLQGTCTILLHETCNIVILVSCKIVIREGGGVLFPEKKKKDRNPWLVGEPHKYFNFVWSFIGTHLSIPWWKEI